MNGTYIYIYIYVFSRISSWTPLAVIMLVMVVMIMTTFPVEVPMLAGILCYHYPCKVLRLTSQLAFMLARCCMSTSGYCRVDYCTTCLYHSALMWGFAPRWHKFRRLGYRSTRFALKQRLHTRLLTNPKVGSHKSRCYPDGLALLCWPSYCCIRIYVRARFAKREFTLWRGSRQPERFGWGSRRFC